MLRSHWERDALGRPLRHQLGNGRTLHRDVIHEWGVDARVHRLTHPGRERVVRYGYDARGTLAWADYGDGDADVRMPNATGNLFRRQDLRDREYARSGQLVFAATETGRARRYAYDDDGNLVEKRDPDGGVWRYTWSAAGYLAKVERPDGKVVELGYDALGRRVRKTFEGKTTRWVWDADVPLHEWIEAAGERPPSSSSSPSASASEGDPETTLAMGPRGAPAPPKGLVTWVFEPGTRSPAAKIVGDERFSIVCDLVGAPVAMHDERGEPVWSAELGIYGQLRELETAEGFERDACPFRWPGQYEDAETGLHYNRYRYYDPEAGQYISQDRLGIRAGLAAYAYVGRGEVAFYQQGNRALLMQVIAGQGMVIAYSIRHWDDKKKVTPEEREVVIEVMTRVMQKLGFTEVKVIRK